MTPAQDRLGPIADASACFDRAWEALQRISAAGEDVIIGDGITHERDTLAARLQSLRDDVADAGNHDE